MGLATGDSSRRGWPSIRHPFFTHHDAGRRILEPACQGPEMIVVIVRAQKKAHRSGLVSGLHHKREVQDEWEGDDGREDRGLRQIKRKRFHTLRPP